ncbi:MAG: response regulator transcription factor [Cyclobacteriaceae bacterium]
MSIRLIVADDHQLFREGLISLISKDDDIIVEAGVNNGKELFEFMGIHGNPDILLLDLTMPEMDGFEVLQKLKSKYPKTRAIAISMHDDGNYIVKCVRAGAYGYLLKNADEEELFEAIHCVYDGKKYFNKSISSKMINMISVEGEGTNTISKKESEILGLISEGLTTKQIAHKLFVSTRTVETHRTNMIKKLDVKNTAQLIKKASELGLFN